MPATKSAEIVTLAMPRRIDAAGVAERADTTTMGGRIAFARLRKGLRQEDVAKALGKSRATIVQYEANNITPPLGVVEEVAKAVGVSPAYLAYGEQTVPIYGKTEIDVVTGLEYRMGKNGAAPVSAFSLPRDFVESFGAEQGQFHAYALNHDAPEFGLRAGDRMFVNTSINTPEGGHDLYLLSSSGGIEVVRVEPNLSAKASGSIKMTGPKGQPFTSKLNELKFIGAVVATLRRQ
jgi:transcriptional regulator with XRE-family HTH domain